MPLGEISHGRFGRAVAGGRGARGAAPSEAGPAALRPPQLVSLDAGAWDGFANPLLRSPAQDPQVLWHGGRYYYCESSPHGIFVRVARHFLDLAQSAPRRVWAPPGRGPASRNLWAPELHFLDGRCYIYFAADDGRNEHHRMWVLAAQSPDPAGPYELAAKFDTAGWAIDGTVFAVGGQRYFVWSGWAGTSNGRQQLYLAPMKSPVELAGPRVVLADPTQAWECRGMPICEAPQVLQRGGRTFLVYSASGSWTEHYCLGLLVHDGSDPLHPASWHHAGPCFQPNGHGWGVGHCGFVTAPDGGDWILYHAKTTRRAGWSDREVRAQPFTWRPDGLPFFGAPVARGACLARPESCLPRLARSA